MVNSAFKKVLDTNDIIRTYEDGQHFFNVAVERNNLVGLGLQESEILDMYKLDFSIR
jgi:hypothetical protein